MSTGAGYPKAQGLYDPKFEHENCGVGLVAQIHGKQSRKVITDADTMLVRMTHRGGCGCEENRCVSCKSDHVCCVSMSVAVCLCIEVYTLSPLHTNCFTLSLSLSHTHTHTQPQWRRCWYVDSYPRPFHERSCRERDRCASAREGKVCRWKRVHGPGCGTIISCLYSLF